ncbi:unnamed protein product [Mytilus edulis]|uniref:Uncharacterized protein n=1 Tax=Mytilus edulis TaxID=6550 RepID=A0A8S3RK05_MYTED|nr:unnamed protein product [Mytilus edulis]
MKKELKKEMMVEIQTNKEKVEQHFKSEVSRLSKRIDSVEFDNANILEKNANLHKENRLLKEEIENTGKRATEAMELSNWNEQYSRKKNIKIFDFPEKKGERLPHSFFQEISKLGVKIEPSEIVAAHRIPGKNGKPRPILVKFMRMESKISILRNRKLINEKLEVRISDDVTKLNQGLLNRLYLHEDVNSAWYFNGLFPYSSLIFLSVSKLPVENLTKTAHLKYTFFNIFVRMVLGIAPPFISTWRAVTANGDADEVEFTVSHDLNELPMKVDVQVRVEFNNTYFYFNALNSAQSGSNNNEYGGIVYMFDETNVKIIAPGPSNCGTCNGYVVYLGGADHIGPPEFPRTFKTGHIRIRAWKMCTFGKPSFLTRIVINNDINTFGTVPHTLSKIDLLIVHVQLQNGYITHADGSASVLTSDQPFGGIMFAYDDSKIRFWSPKKGTGTSNANGAPFSAVEGWGITGNVYNDSSVVAQIFAFKFSDLTQNPFAYGTELLKGPGTTDLYKILPSSAPGSDGIINYLTVSNKEVVELRFIQGSTIKCSG